MKHFLLIVLTVLLSLELQAKVKNVIFMIGDGMGPQQVSLGLMYAKYAPRSVVKGRKLNIEKMMDIGETGLVMTNPPGNLVVDSACSATQYALGRYSNSEMIGLDEKGRSHPTILELARDLGKSTGLVSDTRLTHATPASFAAHQPHRSMENEIAAEMLATNVDVMLSGGLRHWIPKSSNDKNSETYKTLRKKVPSHIKLKSKRKDERNLLNEAEKNSYAVVFNRKQLKSSKSKKILGLFTNSGMPNGIEHSQTKSSWGRDIPTLKEMTEKALETLSKNEKGFFLMVEGGQIDWAGHNNDTGTMLHEMLKFDEAIGAVVEWAKKRDDTLVILTADHETGSFGFSYSKVDIPKGKKLPGKAFKKRLFKPNFNFGEFATLDKIYNQKQSLEQLLIKFDRLDEKKKTPKKLMTMLNKNSPFKITLENAKAIMKKIENPVFDPNHKYLSLKMIPHVHDFSEYYAYDRGMRIAIYARQIAGQQSVVWGTGTHTTTPVMVVTMGPRELITQFDGLHHSSEIGDMAIKALTAK